MVAGLGHTVVAVVPDAGMRAVAERVLPGRTRAGSAEDTGLAHRSVDAVVVGQAYHWFERAPELAEIARILLPRGRLGIVWNVRDQRVEGVRQFVRIVGGQDRTASMDDPLDGLGIEFGPVTRRTFANVQELDAGGLVALAGSYSYVALRPDRDEVLREVRELAAGRRDLCGRGRFELPYLSNCFRASRRDLPGGSPGHRLRS
jgi:SAM-dependent methyltransferase